VRFDNVSTLEGFPGGLPGFKDERDVPLKQLAEKTMVSEEAATVSTTLIPSTPPTAQSHRRIRGANSLPEVKWLGVHVVVCTATGRLCILRFMVVPGNIISWRGEVVFPVISLDYEFLLFLD